MSKGTNEKDMVGFLVLAAMLFGFALGLTLMTIIGG